jgi:phosphonate transport system substrate-binding protein
MATFQREPANMRKALRVIFETPATAPHPLSAHPRIPAQQRERVRQAVLKLGAQRKQAGVLEAVQMPRPVSADYRRDYEPLERLGLNKYVTPSAP